MARFESEELMCMYYNIYIILCLLSTGRLGANPRSKLKFTVVLDAH